MAADRTWAAPAGQPSYLCRQSEANLDNQVTEPTMPSSR
jgi:hypothetical protein